MRELKNLAETVRKTLKLKYDEQSVKFIEEFIEKNKNSFEKEEWDGIINGLGCFIGQCIINNFGGQWEVEKETGSVAVRFSDNNKAYPLTKVSKQFHNGLEDSVTSFYRHVPILFNVRKKPWWKFWTV